MRKGSSDLLKGRDRTTFALWWWWWWCVGGWGGGESWGSGFFLSLLCFHALDVEHLKTIIGNSLSPTARGWSLAQGGERLCSPSGNLVAPIKGAHQGAWLGFPSPGP